MGKGGGEYFLYKGLMGTYGQPGVFLAGILHLNPDKKNPGWPPVPIKPL